MAGTASHKPYLFNADNVAHFAPPAWHVGRTALDVSCEEAERVSRDPRAVLPADEGTGPDAVPEPELLAPPPPGQGFGPADAEALRGQDVWVMHPWSLRPPPPGRTVLALCDAAFHRQFPWTARRWAFVGAALQAAPPRWCDEPQALLQALAAARSVQGDWDPHLDGRFVPAGLAEPAPAFGEPGRRVRSFSQWWAGVLKRQGG